MSDEESYDPKLPGGLQILYEDNHLLAVNKPAGVATMGVKPDRPSLIVAAKQYLKAQYNKPGNVYLGTVSRLDFPVTGVVLFARTSKAAARLSEQFRTKKVTKQYWAIVEGRVEPSQGAWENYLREDKRHRKVHVVGRLEKGAKKARLAYQLIRRLDCGALIEIDLETGRKHQIRVQCACHGMPILGDRKYCSHRTFPSGIALHARRLVVAHPVRGESLELAAPLPESWSRMGVREDWAD